MKKKLYGCKNFIVYFFFLILSFLKGIGLSGSNKFYLIIYLAFSFLVFIKIFTGYYKKKELLLIISLIFLGFLDFYFGGETTVLFSAIGLSCLKNIDIKRIIKIIFYSRLIAFIFMIILPVTGIINMNTLMFFRDGQYITRYAFGFSHPNLTHSSFAILVSLFLYLKFSSIKILDIFLIEILNFSLYQYTFSRTGFYIITIFLILFLLIRNNNKILKFIMSNLNYLYIFFILLSFLMGALYGKLNFMYKLDELTTGRIKFINSIIYNYSIPIFKYKTYEGIAFDNGYIDLVYNGGILAFIIFFFSQIKTNFYIKENNYYEEAFLIFFMLCYSLTESYYMSILMNPSLMFFSLVYFNNKLGGEKNYVRNK